MPCASTLILLLGVAALETGCDRKDEAISNDIHPESIRIETTSFSFSAGDADSPGVNAGYVNDDLCAECHREIFEGFKSVGMSRTFSKPSADTVIEDFENSHYYHEPSDRHYEMSNRDGDYYQRRYQIDEDGRRYNEIEVKIERIIGSGTHVRTYLYRNGDYELYQLPLAWYTGHNEWRMNPGYDKPVHQGFTRRITRNCMFCHNAYPPAPAGSDEYWQPALFPKELPSGHGCQRCHGPGQTHMDVSERIDASTDELNASIHTPGRRGQDQGEDVCLVCHLLPSAGFPSRILRNGRPEFSHRPGESLDEYVYHVDYDDAFMEEMRFEINHHPYRLFQSRCYTESEGDLKCLSCHSPHFKPPPEERVAYNRAACLNCHGVADCDEATMIESVPPGTDHAAPTIANCIPCHMPLRRTQDVIHAEGTDHLIVARPEPEEERLAVRDEFDPERRLSPPRPYWSKHDPPDVNGELHLAIAGAGAGNPQQIKRLQELIAEHQPDFIAPYAALSEALVTAGRHADAIPNLEELIRRFPDNGRAYTGYGQALERMGRGEDAVRAYRTSIEIGPPMPEAFLGLGTAMYHLGRIDEATDFLTLALEARPIYPVARLNLGMVQEFKGELVAARESIDRALAGDPSLTLGYLHLGQTLWKQDLRQEALRVWSQGVKQAPGDARLCEARAMGLLYAARFNEALAEANRGMQMGADEVTCLLVAALAQKATGNEEVARRAGKAARLAAETMPAQLFVRDQLMQQAMNVFGSR